MMERWGRILSNLCYCFIVFDEWIVGDGVAWSSIRSINKPGKPYVSFLD